MSTIKLVTLEMVRDEWCACHWEDGRAKNDAARWAEDNLPATPLEIAGWDKFSAEDRLWLLLRIEIIPHRELLLLACDFAESTLNIFERERPDDSRPRDCIAVARRFANGDATVSEMAAARADARAAGDVVVVVAVVRDARAAGAGAAARAARGAGAARASSARAAVEAKQIAAVKAVLRGMQ